MKKACREAGITEERHAKRQAGIEAGIYRGWNNQRHAGRQRIMLKRQALWQMVRQRDKPGTGWRQA